MSDRENHNDSSSQSGKSYPKGGAAAPGALVVKNISMTVDVNRSQVLSSLTFNGHAVQVSADNSVWDTVSNAYLQPGTDFNPGDLQRK